MTTPPHDPIQSARADSAQEASAADHAADAQAPAAARIAQLLTLLSEINLDDLQAIEHWQLGKLHSKLFFLTESAWIELDFRQEMDRINRNSNEGI